MTLSTATIDKVTEEVRKAADWLWSHESGEHYRGVDPELYKKWYEGSLNRNMTSMNFRLDWEALVAEDLSEDSLRELMVQQWLTDFLDVLENGDVTGAPNDALLKALDGTRKRGVEPEDVQMIGASYYTEYKTKANQAFKEYTLFFRPLIVWPVGEDGNGTS